MDLVKMDSRNITLPVGTLQKSEYKEPLEIQGREKEVKNVKVNKEELEASVNKANKVLFKNNTHLQFRVHEATNEIMVKIIDDETGEVLKEIPPEKMLDMVAKLWEIAGIFVDEKR